MNHSPAYTLVELLIGIGLLSTVSFGGYTAFITAKNNQDLSLSTEHMVDTLRRAHIFSRDGRDELEWGVLSRNESTYELVTRGTINDPVQSNTKYTLPSSVQITVPFTLWFERGTGDANNQYAITVTNKNNNQTTIYIGASGIVRYEYE